MTLSSLQAANDGFYTALNEVLKGHLEPIRDVLSHANDASYVGPMGEVLVGWDAIYESWRQQAAAGLGGFVTPTDQHLTVCGDIGIVVGMEAGEGHTGMPAQVNLRATSIYRVEDGSIKMIAHHTDLLPTDAPDAAI